MTPTNRSRPAFALLLLLAAVCLAAGCAAALGPGYTITSQEIQVQFSPSPEPALQLKAVYQLGNTGNQPLSYLELRLPGRRRFHFVEAKALWDTTSLSFDTSAANTRNVVLFFPQRWDVGTSHTLHLSVEFQRAQNNEDTLNFSSDAFFLPAQGWSPELLPSRGIFATGGIPPKSWNLTVRVPRDFLIHASGRPRHRSSSNSRGEQTLVAVQQRTDPYPFVIAGRYKTAAFHAGEETVNLWTRSAEDPNVFRDSAGALVRAMHAYDATFGARLSESHQLFVVECPALPGCFTPTVATYAGFVFAQNAEPSAEMAALDTIMVDLRGGAKVIAAAVAPSLAASWLGYDRNPGFFQQTPPLFALPAFAAARGREAVQGSQVRAEIIRRVLNEVPPHGSNGVVAIVSARHPESDAVVRAKSFLFFYGLQDRYGQDAFNKALGHMLYARRGGGFDLADLIASFEEETHQNVAEFVRLWMKHTGVPDDFRARYENASAGIAFPEETTP